MKKITTQSTVAIITGDIVASSKIKGDQRQKLHHHMERCSALLHQAFPNVIPFDVDIFRGDSWQILVTDPIIAFRIALFYRTALLSGEPLSVDTRSAIGIGAIDYIPKKRVSEGDGEAYRLSGATLDNLTRARRMALTTPNGADQAIDTIIQLLDGLASHWTARQALAISGALRGWTQGEIAQQLWEHPISQQAIAQHLDRSGWESIETGVSYIEQAIEKHITTSQTACKNK